MRPHRRDPLSRIRRLFARIAERPYLDADCQVLVTADEGVRGAKSVPLKVNADKALHECPDVPTVFVVRRRGGAIPWTQGRDIWYHEAMATAANDCPAEEMDAEDPLFVLYTSGSTGKPKGVLHTTGGYLVYAAMTHKWVFDYHGDDIYWCTADVGWVTGHTYIVYGPLANGAITVVFEGIPTHPDASRFWQVVDKHHVQYLLHGPNCAAGACARRSEIGAIASPDVIQWASALPKTRSGKIMRRSYAKSRRTRSIL
jgi:acetyl-CoA synthetase